MWLVPNPWRLFKFFWCLDKNRKWVYLTSYYHRGWRNLSRDCWAFQQSSVIVQEFTTVHRAICWMELCPLIKICTVSHCKENAKQNYLIVSPLCPIYVVVLKYWLTCQSELGWKQKCLIESYEVIRLNNLGIWLPLPPFSLLYLF